MGVETAYGWHAREGALERLLPPWSQIRVLERPGPLTEGGRVVLEVPIGPVRVRWVLVYRGIVPGREFADEQVDGPFALWRHHHLFEALGPGRSSLRDRVEYLPPFGEAGALLGGGYLSREFERTFRYRHDVTTADLLSHERFTGRPRRTVAISGASGLIGTQLGAFLRSGGHTIRPLVRRIASAGEIAWDPSAGRVDLAAMEGVDAVVHLAGESIAGGRWTAERKRRILDSRVRGTRLVSQAMAGQRERPEVLITASGVGIYGDRGDELLDEDSAIEDGFLGEVGREWEAAAAPAVEAGIRVVHLRFGIVLSPAGGALAQMLPPFLLGAGGPIGSGRQWVSWISIDDAVDVLHEALFETRLAGPVNAMAPEPVQSREFAATLGRVLHRPALVPAPAFALRLLLGDLADEALLASQRAVPARLQRLGFRFRHPTLERAFRHVLGR